MQALRAAVGASLLLAAPTQEGGGGAASNKTGVAAAATAAIDPTLLSRFSRMAGGGAAAMLPVTSLATLAVARLADALLTREAPSMLQGPQGAGVANKSALSDQQQRHPEACLQDATAVGAASGDGGRQQCFRLGLALSAWPPLGMRVAAAHDEGWASTQQAPSSGDAAVPVATALLPDASAPFTTACRALVVPPSAPTVGAAVAAWAAALAPAPRGAEDLLPTHESVCQQPAQRIRRSTGSPLGASGGGADCWPAARERTGVAALDAAYWGVRVALATPVGAVGTRAALRRRAAVVVPVARAAAASPASSGDTASSGGGASGSHERALASAVARQVLEDLHGARGVASDLHLRALVQWLAEAAAVAAAPVSDAGP